MRPGIEDGFARSCYAAPDRIVVATALTDLEYLAPQAIAHAEAAGAELIFFHAVVPDAPPAKATYYNPLKADRDARLTLEVLSRHVRARNVACTVTVRHGQPAELLDEFLRERPSGRLMVGARATGDGDSNRLGSTARQMLLQTPIPVCVLPPETLERNGKRSTAGETGAGSREGSGKRPRTILYTVGECGPQSEGVRFAQDLAQYFHAELVLWKISNRNSSTSGPTPISCSAGLWPRMLQIDGNDASITALLAAVRDNSADMILIEVPPSLGSGACIPATLAELVAQASCPVLTFPVLPLDRQHPGLRVLPNLHSGLDSTSTAGAH